MKRPCTYILTYIHTCIRTHTQIQNNFRLAYTAPHENISRYPISIIGMHLKSTAKLAEVSVNHIKQRCSLVTTFFNQAECSLTQGV